MGLKNEHWSVKFAFFSFFKNIWTVETQHSLMVNFLGAIEILIFWHMSSWPPTVDNEGSWERGFFRSIINFFKFWYYCGFFVTLWTLEPKEVRVVLLSPFIFQKLISFPHFFYGGIWKLVSIPNLQGWPWKTCPIKLKKAHLKKPPKKPLLGFFLCFF